MAKLFMSYLMADKALAIEFSNALSDSGHEVLLFADWVGEVEYRKRFMEVLETFDAVIVVISSRFRETANLRREIGEALVYRDRRGSPQIIPVLLGGELPVDLRAIPSVVGSPDHLKEAAAAVSGLLAQAQAKARVQREDREKLQGRIEQNAAKFVRDSLQRLHNRERVYQIYAITSYALAGSALLFGICFALWRFVIAGSVGDDQWVHLARLVVAGVFVVGLISAFACFAFVMGKSYMVEALRNAERAHAISFGEFYLNAFGERAEWAQVQEAFKNWNIDVGSAFHGQSAKDIDPEILALVETVARGAAQKVLKPSKRG